MYAIRSYYVIATIKLPPIVYLQYSEIFFFKFFILLEPKCDSYDLKPNSSDSYNAAIISVCYDANNKVVYGVIQDSEGNQYSFGAMPSNMEGYTRNNFV